MRVRRVKGVKMQIVMKERRLRHVAARGIRELTERARVHYAHERTIADVALITKRWCKVNSKNGVMSVDGTTVECRERNSGRISNNRTCAEPSCW